MANTGKKDGDTPNPPQQGAQKSSDTRQSQAVAPQGQQQQRGQLARRDQFELMRDPFNMLMRDPFQLMRDMLADPYRLFRQVAPLMGRDAAAWNPEFEVRETDDAFVIRADMPGIRPDDLEVNPMKTKALTNFRASGGKDDQVRLTPPKRATLEQAIAYIDDDEMVEVTPKSIRLRKRFLDANERKRASRAKLSS